MDTDELKKLKETAESSEVAAVFVAIDDLVPWDKNPRFNDQAVEPVMRSIQRFGFANPVIARADNNVVVCGHTRLKAAKSLGMTRVPVRFMDLTDEEATALALADNRLGEIAAWDDGMLGDILEDLGKIDFDTTITGFSQQEIDQLMGNWTDPFWGDDEDNEADSDDYDSSNYGDMDSDEHIEDNGQTIISVNVPVTRAKDATDLIAEVLAENGITHTFRLK